MNCFDSASVEEYVTDCSVCNYNKLISILIFKCEVVYSSLHSYCIRIACSFKQCWACTISPPQPWICHQMETFLASLALVCGELPVIDEFPTQRPVMRIFDVSFYLRLNKRLNKQSRHWWFGTPSRLLWRHCNALNFPPKMSSERSLLSRNSGRK